MGVCAHESVQVGTGPWLSECPWCGRSLLRPLALPADPHNLPSLSAKGLKTHANSERGHTAPHPHHPHPPTSSPGTRTTQPTHASPWLLTCGPGGLASREAGVSVGPRTCSRRGAGNCGHGEQRSAGRGWAERRWAEGRRREGAARGEAGEARGSGRSWGHEARRLRGGAGTCRSRGPETRPAASVQIKAFRCKRARPCPSWVPYRSAPNGGLGGRERIKGKFPVLSATAPVGRGGGGVWGLK